MSHMSDARAEQIGVLNERIHQLQQYLISSDKKSQFQSQRIDLLQAQLNIKIHQKQLLQQNFDQLNQKLTAILRQYAELNQIVTTKNFQVNDLLQQKEQLQSQISKYQKSEIKKNQQIKNLQQKIVAIELLQKQLQRSRSEIKEDFQFIVSEFNQATRFESKLKKQVKKLKKQLNLKNQSKPQIRITDIINHPEYLRIKNKLLVLETQNISSEGSVQRQISERMSFIPSRVIGNADHRTETPEEVFAECNFLNTESKNFLLDEIKRIKKLPIKKTKLILKLDKLSPINPHEFVDNIPNIVLVIELANKKVLAAFTQAAFSKEQLFSKVELTVRHRLGANKSLILDLTNKVAFTNNKPQETIMYDKKAIIWGKNELIIKNDEPTLLYICFGIEEGVYGDGKYTAADLLGNDKGFERINQYEFYRIYIG